MLLLDFLTLWTFHASDWLVPLISDFCNCSSKRINVIFSFYKLFRFPYIQIFQRIKKDWLICVENNDKFSMKIPSEWYMIESRDKKFHPSIHPTAVMINYKNIRKCNIWLFISDILCLKMVVIKLGSRFTWIIKMQHYFSFKYENHIWLILTRIYL